MKKLKNEKLYSIRKIIKEALDHMEQSKFRFIKLTQQASTSIVRPNEDKIEKKPIQRVVRCDHYSMLIHL